MVLIYLNGYRAQGLAGPGNRSVDGKRGCEWELVMEVPVMVRKNSV
jgi:hypothetical protein